MWDWITGDGSWGSEVLKNIVGILIQGVTEAIKVISTWWFYLPVPVLEGVEGGLSPAQRVQEYTGWAVTAVGLISTIFAVVMIARNRNPHDVVNTIGSLMRVILVSGAAIPAAWLLLKFSDTASPWLLNAISGGTFEDGLGQLSGGDAAAAAGMGVGTLTLLLPVLVISILGGILNMVLIMFSYGALPAIVGLLPVGAAYAMSERGEVAFGKQLGWLGALVLFKPVAAVLYGVGIAASKMISGGVEDAGQVVIQSLYGGIVLAAAGIALPVLIRLVAPAAAAGSQGAGAGGLLVGAGMVALGAVTGGASAVAATGATTTGAATTGAATTGAATTGAATTGAATTGSAGAAGTAGTSGAGTAGAAGKSGASSTGGTGKSGPSGANGKSGGNGSSGSGEAGTPGATGATGGSGRGTSGEAGASAGAAPSGATPPSTSPNGGGGGAPSHGAAGSGAAANRPETTWAERMKAEGAAHIRSQGAMADRAAEQGDDR